MAISVGWRAQKVKCEMKKTFIYSACFFLLGLIVGMGLMRLSQVSPAEESVPKHITRQQTGKRATDLYAHMKSKRTRHAREVLASKSEAPTAQEDSAQPGSIKDGEGIIVVADTWLADLKADDPEAYVAVTNDIEMGRQFWKRDTQKRCEFLESLDLRLIPEESRQDIASLLSLLKEQQAYGDEVYEKLLTENAPSEIDEEAHFERLIELREEIAEAYEKNRKVLQVATLTALDLPEERFQAVIDTLKIIDEMTSEEPLSSTKEEVMQLENSQNP